MQSTTTEDQLQALAILASALEPFREINGTHSPMPLSLAGQTQYGEILIERGITLDNNFEQWANKLWYYPKPVRTWTSRFG
jgi:hypothetical protein